MSPAATLPLTQHLHITCFHVKQFSNSHIGGPVRPQLALAPTLHTVKQAHKHPVQGTRVCCSARQAEAARPRWPKEAFARSGISHAHL